MVFLIVSVRGFRFSIRYGPGAVVALVHDVLVTASIWVIFGLEFDLQVLAALLTIIGYSVNDTIVVFDRVRENLTLRTKRELEEVVNRSLNQTLSRTLLTAGTVFLPAWRSCLGDPSSARSHRHVHRRRGRQLLMIYIAAPVAVARGALREPRGAPGPGVAAPRARAAGRAPRAPSAFAVGGHELVAGGRRCWASSVDSRPTCACSAPRRGAVTLAGTGRVWGRKGGRGRASAHRVAAQPEPSPEARQR
jgi:hypothetical protein